LAGNHADESKEDVSFNVEKASLLDGLEGEARRDRSDLIEWLIGRGFTADQIRASLSPMMLPANRLIGDDGSYVSAREVARAAGMELELLQRLQRAVGLPRVDDPDAAVLPRADAEAAVSAKFLVDIGMDPDDVVAIVKVLTEGIARAAAMIRLPTFKILVQPGASEIELAASAESLASNAAPLFGPLLEDLLLLEFRHMFEAEAITVTERASGKLPGARQIAVGFADLVGFTRLGEALPPEELVRFATGLAKLAHETAAPPVSFIKTIGDAVMFVSADTVSLIDAVLHLVSAAADNDLPQLRAGVAYGLAAGRAGDWFGSPVNVASRITAIARPETVLVANSARESARAGGHFVWMPAGAHHLRGVPGQVELFRVSRDRRTLKQAAGQCN
jgi:adenylate cyclase